jgi:hypothetical protein
MAEEDWDEQHTGLPMELGDMHDERDAAHVQHNEPKAHYIEIRNLLRAEDAHDTHDVDQGPDAEDDFEKPGARDFELTGFPHEALPFEYPHHTTRVDLGAPTICFFAKKVKDGYTYLRVGP